MVGRDDTDHVLIRNSVTETNSLRYVLSARAPHKSVLERLLERTMDLITHVLHARIAPNDQRFGEVRIDAFPAKEDVWSVAREFFCKAGS